MLQRGFVFLLILLLAPLAGAQPSAAEQKVLDRALVLTGVDIAVGQIDLAYRHSLAVSKPGYKLDDAQRAALKRVLAPFNAAAIQKKLRSYLSKKYQERPMQSVLGLQNNRIAKKFRSYERIAGASQQRGKLEEYLATMDQHPVSDSRVELLRATSAASYTVALAALVQAHADVDTAVALDFISAENISRNDSQGISLWQRKLEKSYRKQFGQLGDGYLIFAYRFLNDEQLTQYIELWQDKNMQWFMEAAVAGLREVLREQHKQLVEDLAP